MESISAVLAFGAGVASILSPCILPLLPAYVGYLAGTGESGPDEMRPSLRWTALGRAVAFVAGFSLVFVAMGASASLIGQLFLAYKPWLGKIGGLIIIIFGLAQIGVLNLPLLERGARLSVKVTKMDLAGAAILGISFAAGWTPCVGPILAAILLYAGTQATLGTGVYLLSVYSLGLAVPFLIIALGIDYVMALLKKRRKALIVLSKASGAVMIAFGLLMLTDFGLF